MPARRPPHLRREGHREEQDDGRDHRKSELRPKREPAVAAHGRGGARQRGLCRLAEAARLGVGAEGRGGVGGLAVERGDGLGVGLLGGAGRRSGQRGRGGSKSIAAATQQCGGGASPLPRRTQGATRRCCSRFEAESSLHAVCGQGLQLTRPGRGAELLSAIQTHRPHLDRLSEAWRVLSPSIGHNCPPGVICSCL